MKKASTLRILEEKIYLIEQLQISSKSKNLNREHLIEAANYYLSDINPKGELIIKGGEVIIREPLLFPFNSEGDANLVRAGALIAIAMELPEGKDEVYNKLRNLGNDYKWDYVEMGNAKCPGDIITMDKYLAITTMVIILGSVLLIILLAYHANFI